MKPLSTDNYIQIAFMAVILISSLIVSHSIDAASHRTLTVDASTPDIDLSKEVDKLTARLDDPVKVDFSSIGGNDLDMADDNAGRLAIYATTKPQDGDLGVTRQLVLQTSSQ